MCRVEELKEEHERIMKSLELHKGLLSTLLRIKSETRGFEEVVKGEARIIAIFDDRRKKLEKFLE
ncbi:MAG: hypothetical protein QXL78_03120 [Methanocellales archaeon]